MKTYFLSVLTVLLMVSCKGETAQPETVVAENQTEETAKEEVVELSGYKIGDVATDFSLKNIDGKTVSLTDYTEAKGFIVTFTCNHCPYAMAYEDRIIALDKKYRDLGYPVIAINPNNPEKQPEDSFENMTIRAKEKGFAFPYLLDDGQHIFPQYGATKTPHIFVLQKTADGNIVKYIGAVDDNYQDETEVTQKYVEEAVDALLKGEKVPVEVTKAIGCTIKI
ncbi:MAG: thioredoxin family protein [Flavobacteriaceae bacterium]